MMSSEQSDHVVKLRDAGATGGVARDGGIRTVAKNVINKSGENSSAAYFDENAHSGLIHGFNGFADANRTSQMIHGKLADLRRVLRMKPCGRATVDGHLRSDDTDAMI